MVALRNFPTLVPDELPTMEFERAVSLAVLVAEMEERHGVQLTRQPGFQQYFERLATWSRFGRSPKSADMEASLYSYNDHALALAAKLPQRPMLYRRVAAPDIRVHPSMESVYAKHARLLCSYIRVMSLRRR